MLRTLITISLIAAATARQTPRKLIVDSAGDDLVWPLPQSNDLMTVMLHALHCKQVAEAPIEDGELGAMHHQHCEKFTREVAAAPMPDAPTPTLCQTLFGVGADYLKSRVGGAYSYGLVKFTNESLVETPRATLMQLGGWNYGQLLLKESRGDKMTTAEKAFLASWFAPLKLQQARLAFECDAMQPVLLKQASVAVWSDALQCCACDCCNDGCCSACQTCGESCNCC